LLQFVEVVFIEWWVNLERWLIQI